MTEGQAKPGTGKRVYATCDIGPEALQCLRGRGYALEVHPEVTPPPRAVILERVQRGIDGLITTLRDPIDAEVLAAGAAHGLRVVAQDAVGFNNIDRAAANRHGIPFTNTAEVLTEATAEFAFFIMGCLARRLYSSERLVREHQWKDWHPHQPFLGDEVTGKTIAVIGVGRIGRAMVKKCVGLDMDILCYDPFPVDESFVARVQEVMDRRHAAGFSDPRRTITVCEFDQALARADFVTLHVPLLREGESDAPTYHLMDAAALGRMKPTAYLINTARGPIVDEAALHRALQDGVIAGAALDVFEVEPLPAASPLRDPALEERCRIFHHFASSGKETRLSLDPERGMAGRTVQGLRDVLEGNYGGDPTRMPYVVNKEAFTAG